MRPRFALATLTAAVVLGVLATSAFALYPQLSAKLTGPAIGGVTPEGDAKIDQSKYPSIAPRLDVRVKNLNLPDGTTCSSASAASTTAAPTTARRARSPCAAAKARSRDRCRPKSVDRPASRSRPPTAPYASRTPSP